jgi:hypothetical protein
LRLGAALGGAGTGRLLIVGERNAAVVLALLLAPAAAAGAAAAPVLAGRFRRSTAVAAPLGRNWLRGRAGASSRLLAVLRTANSGFRGEPETRGGAVQVLADELDDDLANELGDRTTEPVSDERLERRRGRGHVIESTSVLGWKLGCGTVALRAPASASV